MIETGFTNAAIESAHVFRSIMQAMSRPGVPVMMEAAVEAPAPLGVTSAAVALTLCDFQTPLWLSPAIRSESVQRYLRFHSGAPVTEQIGEAHFAFLLAGDDWQSLDVFAHGTHEYPDRSATVVIQVEGFRTRDAVLSGPGIRGTVDFGVEGLENRFWTAMAENHQRFPVGIDVIFAAPRSIAALPRSTAVQIEETV
jgi:alpha-D-ribose 1-methylphosphonate 5-triphosphate synthase subunit PhnH